MHIDMWEQRASPAIAGQETRGWSWDTEPKEVRSPYALNVMTVHENALTLSWAQELHGHVIRMVGAKGLVNSSWRLADLGSPHVWPAAVQAALGADVILVSLQAREEVPLKLWFWCTVWVSRRLRRPGLLLGLIGLPEQAADPPSPTPGYLQAVAHKAGLDYLQREHRSPGRGNCRRRERDRLRAEARAEVVCPLLGVQASAPLGWRLR